MSDHILGFNMFPKVQFWSFIDCTNRVIELLLSLRSRERETEREIDRQAEIDRQIDRD